MKDLDMSDVYADARDMQDQFLSTMFAEFQTKTEIELREMRYKAGQLARQGNIYAMDAVEMIDYIIFAQFINTTLCEGCLGRTGCDMCCPYEPTMMDMIPAGTPDSWIPDNPNEDGFRQSDFI